MVASVCDTARRRLKRALVLVGVALALAVGVAPAQAVSRSSHGGPGGHKAGHKVG